jgi:L-alanine-DL-glutamate epimerase-like enolase superfamily enzyme
MMPTSRRKFLAISLTGGLAVAIPGTAFASNTETNIESVYKLLDEILKKEVLKKVLFTDSNGSYNTEEAIKIGKLLQEYKYVHYEEPVPFDWYEETKQVAYALTIPIAGGEQEASMHNFRWLIANDALQIVQPDVYYFGGMIRSTRVARMAAAFGKPVTPHISDGLGFMYMMHFVSTLPNAGPFHEFKGNSEIPVECKTSSLKIDNGVIKVPTGPGSGVLVDPDYLKNYKILTT